MAPKRRALGKEPVEDRRSYEVRTKTQEQRAFRQQPTPAQFKMMERKVLRPRAVDFHDISEVLPELASLLQIQQGLVSFMADHRKVYHSLVHQFYGNMIFKSNKYMTRMNGQPFLISSEVMSAVFKMPDAGDLYGEAMCDEEVVYKLLTGEDLGNRSIIGLNANRFPPLQRILHHMITTILLPKGGAREKVTDQQIFIISSIMQRRQINFAALLTGHITSCFHQRNRTLPYAAALSQVFDCAGLPLRKELCQNLRSGDIYTVHSICKNMGYKKTPLGHLIRTLKSMKGKAQEADSDEDEEEEVPIAPGEPSQTPAASPDTYETQLTLETLSGDVGELRESVDSLTTDVAELRLNHTTYLQTFESINHSLDYLKTAMDAHHQQFSDMFAFISHNPPPPGPGTD